MTKLKGHHDVILDEVFPDVAALSFNRERFGVCQPEISWDDRFTPVFFL